MFIFSNLATSLDGKIATSSRVHFPLGTAEDRRQMQRLLRECDAVLMGASTLRAYRKPRTATGMPKPPVNVILSSSLKGVSPDWPFFRDAAVPRILVVGHSATARALKPFAEKSDIIQLKKPTARRPLAVQVVEELSKRGVRRLLVEGGGSVMWDFVSANLIDEYHVTLTPRLLGGTEAPTLVDGPGFPPEEVVNLKLEQCRVLGDELYLIYRRASKRG